MGAASKVLETGKGDRIVERPSALARDMPHAGRIRTGQRIDTRPTHHHNEGVERVVQLRQHKNVVARAQIECQRSSWICELIGIARHPANEEVIAQAAHLRARRIAGNCLENEVIAEDRGIDRNCGGIACVEKSLKAGVQHGPAVEARAAAVIRDDNHRTGSPMNDQLIEAAGATVDHAADAAQGPDDEAVFNIIRAAQIFDSCELRKLRTCSLRRQFARISPADGPHGAERGTGQGVRAGASFQQNRHGQRWMDLAQDERIAVIAGT